MIPSELLTFTFKEVEGIPRSSEPARLSVCLARGALDASVAREIVEADSGLVVENASAETLSLWPDGSVRWLMIELGVTIAAFTEKTYSFAVSTIEACEKDSQTASTPKPRLLSSPTIESGQLTIGLGPEGSRSDAMISFYCIDNGGTRRTCRVDSILESDQNDTPDRLDESFKSTFELQLSASETLSAAIPNMTARIDVFSTAGLIEIELCAHNPAAAAHPKGLWDLGDPASQTFTEIGLFINHPEGELIDLLLSATSDYGSFNAAKSLDIEQLSSGGSNSNSPVHVDKEGIHPQFKKGFEIHCDGMLVAEGARTSPSGAVRLPSGSLTTHLSRFWQEFPSALRLTPQSTTVAMFAKLERQHELQPGERKRRTVSLHFEENGTPTQWLSCRLAPAQITECNVTAPDHFQRACNIKSELESKLSTLILSPDEFYGKRETIDEYGWRNFGEVFADHETLYQGVTDKPLISHYNNQYDQVLGFGLQFLRTQDARWLELMNDLARHVTDIDIYHTTDDRVEYNNGLFWHTNHYEDAATATHRSFSIKNYDPANPVGLSGGPGPEHCYTSGLALHYFLTGDHASKQAVIDLAEWIKRHFHGDHTFIGRLHSIAKHELSAIIKLLRGRYVSPYRYPFTRGTGNLIVALLDAHSVSGDRNWIDRAEKVLFSTFHPDDDPTERNLDNIERTWSHMIFLQAVLRFIATKDSLGEFDIAREYARDGFLTYAKYTLEHGNPYLDDPERLEFVNDTWAAQDIRRYGVMCAAAYHDPSSADAYRKKAMHFGNHILERLSNSDETHFARIQAIIMQNMGSATWFEQHADPAHQSGAASAMSLPPVPTPSILTELRSTAQKLGMGLKRFDAKKELHWLRLHLGE